MALRNYFLDQIAHNRVITSEVESKISYRRVWSGKLINIGDKVLYAFALDPDNNKLLFSLLESELDELGPIFEFVEMMDETIPILRRIK